MRSRRGGCVGGYVVLCCCEGGSDSLLGLQCAHGSDGDTPSTWEVEGEHGGRNRLWPNRLWLAQAISVQVTSCFSGEVRFGFSFVSKDVVRCRDDDGSPGQVASIDQGPKSEKWPLKAPQKPAPAVRAVPKPNLNPDEQLKAAQSNSRQPLWRLAPAAAGLKEALAKARVQAQLRPVQDRIAHTEAFLDRSRKKMEVQSAEVSRIQEVMAELRAKIQDGVNRLEVLQTEAKAQASPFTVPTNPQAEIRLLRARIAQMDGSAENDTQEGASKRSKMCATSSVDQVPSCASRLRLAEDFVPMCDEDVVRWMQDRQAHMQEATLAQGCATSWALQPQVGQQSLAVHGVQRSSAMKMVPTWGCRGVRVGEASRPCSHPPGQDIGEVHADRRLI